MSIADKNKESVIKELFELYYAPLVVFTRLYVDNDEVGRDMVQDVFLHIIEGNLKEIESIDNFKAYLYSSVKNRCLKYVRHQVVKHRYETQVHVTDEDDYTESIIEEEVFILLKQEINKLPQMCKKVFELMLHGKGNAEIATILGIGIETVKSHKKYGKKLLQENMGDVFLLFAFYLNIDHRDIFYK